MKSIINKIDTDLMKLIPIVLFIIFVLIKFPYQYYTNLFLIIILISSLIIDYKIGLITSLPLMALFVLTDSSMPISFNLLFADTTRILFFTILLSYIFLFYNISNKKNGNFVIDKIFYFYLFIVSIYFIIGFIKWPNKIETINELFLFLFWLLPLILPKYLQKKHFEIYKIVFVLSFSFIIFTYFFSYLNNTFNYPNNRIYTRQINIILYLFPFIYSSFIFIKGRSSFLYLLLSILAIITTIISQTRSVMMLLITSIFIIHILNKKLSIKTFIKAIIILIVFISVFFLSLKIILPPKIFESRFNILNFYKDFSFLLRVIVAADVITKLKYNLLIGCGLGNLFTFTPGLFKFNQNYWVDIGYLSILGKTGIVGLISILIIYSKIFISSFKIYIRNSFYDTTHKILIYSVLSSFPILLIQNFMMSVLIKYLYIIFYIFLLSWTNYYNYLANNQQKSI